jgi:hypothetical protein
MWAWMSMRHRRSNRYVCCACRRPRSDRHYRGFPARVRAGPQGHRRCSGGRPGTEIRTAARLELTQLAETGKLTVFVAATYPLAEAADALRELAAGHTHGKDRPRPVTNGEHRELTKEGAALAAFWESPGVLRRFLCEIRIAESGIGYRSSLAVSRSRSRWTRCTTLSSMRRSLRKRRARRVRLRGVRA